MQGQTGLTKRYGEHSESPTLPGHARNPRLTNGARCGIIRMSAEISALFLLLVRNERMPKRPPQIPALSRRERQVMDILFRIGEATAAEVMAELPDPPTYSSVR